MGCTANVLPALDGCTVRPVKGIKRISVLTAGSIDGGSSITYNSTETQDLGGARDFCNIKSTAIIVSGIPIAFKHTFEILNTLVLTDADKKLLDESDSIIVGIVTNDDKALAYGCTYKLWKDKQSRDINANHGQISASFSSMDGMEEPYSSYLWTEL